MAAPLSPEAKTFLKEVVYAHLATLMKDGSPQVTPVWVDTDGTNILINTAVGRVKMDNMERNARVALSIMGMENAYRCLFVRGRVKEIAPDEGNRHISSLSKRYTGNDRYQGRPGETRMRVVIEPLHVTERLGPPPGAPPRR